MDETEYQLIKGVGFVIALILAVGLQRVSAHSGEVGSWRVNASLWVANAILVGLVCGGCACTASRWANGAGFGLLNTASMPYWLSIALSVLLLDFVSYLWHRANHVIPLLWRLHQVHHSDLTFTATTALRFHPGELLLALPVRLAAVVALGLPIEGLIVFEVWFAFANFFEHGDIDLPLKLEARLARAFVTPALHRRHHSRKLALLNSNYGTIFTFWDRLFGTFGASSSATSVRIGLPGVAQPLSVLRALALPGRGDLRGEENELRAA
jgi:sterol desaturase/sphingolipid hydroxylase (fatty acid hydroxylase superfamily)